ncbi:toprim domain-containing protein [Paenibacillus chitinolyticus]|uniref:toprim domain-containing protein n=1 Tax=Paenibacillus chitinolyticus TaxID=79263 RepID=UPI003D072048
MTDDQKKELVTRVEEKIGIGELFRLLEMNTVKTKGGNVYCVCPFHEGADNPNGFAWSNGFGFCFTQCNRKYDLFDIVMRMKGYDFVDASSFLSDLVGMEVEFSRSPSASLSDGLENRDFLSKIRKAKAKRKTVEWNPLPDIVFTDIEPVLHSMLRREGFDNDVRDYFDIGYARSGYLSNRITIPVDYIDGSIVTISGRSVLPADELKMHDIRRYQIWYDTDKGVTLYNISRADPYIAITKEVFVVEGFKSVWRMHQWGYRNTVAAMGTSLTDGQRRLLLKLGAKIIVCGDRDKAGKEFNQKVKESVSKFSDFAVMDMYNLDVPDKTSIDDISKEQFDFLYQTTK